MIGTLSRDELTTKINRGDNFLLIETLPEFMYQQGHLPVALNLPPDRVAELAPQMLKDKNAEIVVYCGGPT